MVYVPPKDRVLEHSTTNHQTVWSVTGAIDPSYQAFSDHMSVGDTTYGAYNPQAEKLFIGLLKHEGIPWTAWISPLLGWGAFSTGTKDIFMGTPAAIIATLGANTFTGAQILGDQQVSRAMLIDSGWTYLSKGNSSTTTQTLDYTAGQHQSVTATGNHTVATSNWPPTGNLGELLFEAINYGAYTITWPTINWLKPDGTTTTTFATYLAANTGRTALQSSGTDFILLWSRDAGTTVYGKLV